MFSLLLLEVRTVSVIELLSLLTSLLISFRIHIDFHFPLVHMEFTSNTSSLSHILQEILIT